MLMVYGFPVLVIETGIGIEVEIGIGRRSEYNKSV